MGISGTPATHSGSVGSRIKWNMLGVAPPDPTHLPIISNGTRDAGGGAMMQQESALLTSSLVCLPWDANPQTSQGVQKVINRKPAASPVFLNFNDLVPIQKLSRDTKNKAAEW